MDSEAGIHIPIGRDAPELLKVRAFKNGPKGAPWAQKLDLGWTISGQLCLDRVGGPVHISAHRTVVTRDEETLGNLRSTTKETTTTSIDRARGDMKVKKRSACTTTTT